MISDVQSKQAHYQVSCRQINLMQQPHLLLTFTQYYYYNKWTRQRISDLAPQLPEPVVVKLLGTDANDLDLLLQHPAGLRAQVRKPLAFDALNNMLLLPDSS